MNTKMKSESVNNFIDLIDFNKNEIDYINDDFYLTNYQTNVLNKANIDYKNVNTVSELMFLISYTLEETLDEELEIILDEISQTNYYQNTNK